MLRQQFAFQSIIHPFAEQINAHLTHKRPQLLCDNNAARIRIEAIFRHTTRKAHLEYIDTQEWHLHLDQQAAHKHAFAGSGGTADE